MRPQKKRLGELLVENGVITDQQLKYALVLQKTTGRKLGEVLIAQGFLNEMDIMDLLGKQLDIKFIDLSRIKLDPKLASSVPLLMARRYNVVPFQIENNKLNVALEDPLDFVAIEDLRKASKLEVVPFISHKESIVNAIRQLYGSDYADKAVKEYSLKEPIAPGTLQVMTEPTLDEVGNAPVVRLLDSIIEQAVQMKASDIHIEPGEDEVRIRTRVDGVLRAELTVPKHLLAALVVRIKIIGGMDIAEKRIPQDGRIQMTILERQIDLRISVMPTWFGEKVVFRILDRSGFIFQKEKIGFSPEKLSKFNELLRNPHGLILVVGPTGSGKTTTLYAMLNDINLVSRNIITIEDPVEYMMKGINQTQVNVKAGLTFAIGLRALLRQDPDVVMVGEIRDRETAEIAVRAAITGHLVLSTLHANDTVSTVVRLVDMGIDNYLLAASLSGVISQRLVRKICPSCKTPYIPQDFEREILGIAKDATTTFYKGQGCSQCEFSGYKGRTPVFEILVIDGKHREMISKKMSMDSIREYSRLSGMSTLMDECVKLLGEGTITFDEAIRVSYSKEG